MYPNKMMENDAQRTWNRIYSMVKSARGGGAAPSASSQLVDRITATVVDRMADAVVRAVSPSVAARVGIESRDSRRSKEWYRQQREAASVTLRRTLVQRINADSPGSCSPPFYVNDPMLPWGDRWISR